jgi:Type I restriction modification DNA specificity domain
MVSMTRTAQSNSASVQLRSIAHVQPGYLSRTGVRSVPTGTHRLLQARDVSLRHGLRMDAAVRFTPERNPDLYRVSRGDILLTARGQDHQAFLVDVTLPDVLASSVFYIIRPREDVLPGYLAWWLNQPDTKAALEFESRGTGIGYIARPLMEHISVVVPPLEVQRQIVEAMDLWQRQQSIQARLDQQREHLIHAICRQAIGLGKE